MGDTGDCEHDERLRSLMAAMARKDSGALFRFIDEFRAELSRTVRSIVGSMSRGDVSRKAAEVDFLVLSAALVVFDRAPGWQPGGAAPWVWANRAIRDEVVRWLGQPRVEFIAECHAAPGGAGGSGGSGGAGGTAQSAGRDVTYEALAPQCEDVARWLAEVRQVAGERDQRVHIEYQTQKALGDPSPANTVAAQFGLQPANVRQIDARVRRRLDALIGSGLVPW